MVLSVGGVPNSSRRPWYAAHNTAAAVAPWMHLHATAAPPCVHSHSTAPPMCACVTCCAPMRACMCDPLYSMILNPIGFECASMRACSFLWQLHLRGVPPFTCKPHAHGNRCWRGSQGPYSGAVWDRRSFVSARPSDCVL